MKKYELFETNDQVNRTEELTSTSNLEKLKTVMYATTHQKIIGEKDQAYEELKQALKRNEPVRLLVHDDNYGMVEAKSAEDYKYDEWWCAMGYCPICGEQNPIVNNFCGKCGNKLDNDWSDK